MTLLNHRVAHWGDEIFHKDYVVCVMRRAKRVARERRKRAECAVWSACYLGAMMSSRDNDQSQPWKLAQHHTLDYLLPRTLTRI